MKVSRRAFLMVGAGAVAAKALEPLMKLLPQEPLAMPTIPQEVLEYDNRLVDVTQVLTTDPQMFSVGDCIVIDGDKHIYQITSVARSGMLRIDERVNELLTELDAYHYEPKKARRTYPKHFRSRQRDPWFAFAS